jgi:hypothetical protein
MLTRSEPAKYENDEPPEGTALAKSGWFIVTNLQSQAWLPKVDDRIFDLRPE